MIRYYIYTPSGALVNDPERSVAHFRSVSFGSMWPKGYATFNATVDRDIFDPWLIKTGYRIVVRDGQKSIYDGRLSAPAASFGDSKSEVKLSAQGWFIILTERTIRKRWIDTQFISRIVWPASTETSEDQTAPIIEKREKDQVLHVVLRSDDATLTVNDYYTERYYTPTGAIHKVDYDYSYRTGEGFDFILVGLDTTVEDTETVISTVQASGSVGHTFTQGSTSGFDLRVAPSLSGGSTYDQNDWASFTNFVVYMEYESGHSVATPTYAVGEIVEDVLLLSIGSEISADMSQIGGPSTTLDAFITRDDGYQKASSIIEDLSAFSDGSQVTYGLAVWDGDASSDGKPLAYYAARVLTNFEYDLSARDPFVIDYSIEYSDAELHNWVTVKWKDADGIISYLSPNQDSDLKNTDSITEYGERHSETLDAGESSQADAKLMAQRYLAYHKNPLYKGGITVQGKIRKRGGAMVDVSHVRAGQRIYIRELESIIFIRETSYDVDSDTLTITPDIPGDDITH